jgi:hypothetical protein
MMGCLPDLAAVTLIVLALGRHGQGKRGVAPLLAFAALTRETSLVAAAAVAFVELRERRIRAAATALLVPLAVVVAWRIWVFAQLGSAGAEAAGGNLGIPLSWIPQKLAKPIDAVEAVALAALALGFAGLPALLPSMRRWTAVEAAYAGFAALFLAASGPNYLVIWWGYSRTVLPLAALSVLVAAQPGPQWRRWLFRSVAVAWSLVGVMLLYRWAIPLAVALALAALLPARPREAAAPAR